MHHASEAKSAEQQLEAIQKQLQIRDEEDQKRQDKARSCAAKCKAEKEAREAAERESIKKVANIEKVSGLLEARIKEIEAELRKVAF